MEHAMSWLISLTLIFLTLTLPSFTVHGAETASQQSQRAYDSQGRLTGSQSSDGRQYDSQGRYIGRVDTKGRQYDKNNNLITTTTSNGRQYDSQGRYLGEIRQGR